MTRAHAGIEDTFTAYSSFVTREDNAHYETLLPAANKLYAPALAQTTEREQMEAQLVRFLPFPDSPAPRLKKTLESSEAA